MSIPKIIHYCWFGRNPKPKLAQKCFESWKKYCPDYEIIEWNEDNYSIDKAPLYVRQAYDAKRWAFVTDYVRLQVVYENGGIYLDTDVEVIKSLEGLLVNKAYFGLEDGMYVATGLGFGAEKGCQILLEMMLDYQDIPYILENGKYDTTPCPKRNTNIFLKYGMQQNDCIQKIIENIIILPSEYLNPKDEHTGKISITPNTYSIHHYTASWWTPEMHKQNKKKLRKEKMKRLPSTIGHKILGKERYERIRAKLKKL